MLRNMTDGDFYGNEQSAVIGKAGTVKIEFTPESMVRRHGTERSESAGR